MITERIDYSLAVGHIQIAPSLDLEELLDKEEWKSPGILSDQQLQILKQGKQFIALAQEGRAIGISTVEDGTLDVNMSAITAYLMSYRAYKMSEELKKLELEQVFKIANSVLTKLTLSPLLPQQYPDDDDVDVTRTFFSSLASIPFKSE